MDQVYLCVHLIAARYCKHRYLYISVIFFKLYFFMEML